MNGMRMTVNETCRLFRLKRTWLFIFILSITPILLCTDLLGLGTRYFTGTMTDVLMLEPAKLAVFVGSFTTLFLTLLTMQRTIKFRMNSIIESTTDPMLNHLRQTMAIMLVACFSLLISFCVLLPYTAIFMRSIFSVKSFLSCWILIYLGGIIITILFAAGLFMLTRNFEISFLIVGSMIILSEFNGQFNNFLCYWLQTNLFTFSDVTGGQLQIDIILYSRAVWVLISSGIYVLGLACVRKYGQNLFLTFIRNSKKVVLPLFMVMLIISGGFLAHNQPFFDNGPFLRNVTTVDPKTGLVSTNTDQNSFIIDSTQNSSVIITSGKADITIDTQKRLLSGVAVFTIKNPLGWEEDVPLTISPGLEIKEVVESAVNVNKAQTKASTNSVKINFKKNKDDNFMASVYHLKLTAARSAVLRIVYEGSLKNRKDTQMNQNGITDEYVFINQLYPRLSVNSLQEVTCTLTLPEKLTPLMPSTEFTETAAQKEGYRTYTFSSPYPQWLIAGDYVVENLKAGGLNIKFAYFKKAEQIMKKNKASQVVGDAVNFFTRKFGALDFHGQPLIIAELDASVSGGWAIGNMSMFAEDMFAGSQYKANPDLANQEGGSGIGVAVHEIAHQWWGWGPSSALIQGDGTSPWSAEGLTCYSTYLYLKERFGEDYAKREITDPWMLNTKKMQNAFYISNLQYINKMSNKDAATIYQKYASSTLYDVMPYLLMKAANLSGGEDTFVKKLSGLYQSYNGKILSYNEFLSYMHLTKEEMKID